MVLCSLHAVSGTERAYCTTRRTSSRICTCLRSHAEHLHTVEGCGRDARNQDVSAWVGGIQDFRIEGEAPGILQD
eukprot:3401811-Rhodomonas_salina.2